MTLGLLLAVLYPHMSPAGQKAIGTMLGENSAPLSFHFLASLVVAVAGICVACSGRTRTEPSFVRQAVIYKPAEFCLAYASSFFGLMIGYGFGLFPTSLWPQITALLLLGFLFSVGLLILVLFASFEGSITRNEGCARLAGVCLGLSALGVIGYEYFI